MSLKKVIIPTPPLEDLQCFCSERAVPPVALLELSWALVLHSYFDICTFLVKQNREASKGNDDAGILVNFLPELASSTPAVEAIQWDDKLQSQKDTVLHRCCAKDFDSSSQKIWSRLQIYQNSYEPQRDDNYELRSRRNVCP